MSAQEGALTELATLLESARIPYMVIGGMANAVWGEPRATLDVDATVWVAEPEVPAVVERLTSELTSLVTEAVAFVARTRVLPLQTAAGVRIDLIFGLLPFEEEAIRRAVAIPIGGQAVRFCTAEDLILHKVISDRERDLADARGVTLRRLRVLDLAYLEPRLAELARLLERPEIMDRWNAWKEEAPGPSGA